MDQKIHTAINWLSRQQIVELLEGNGMACYESESIEDLREALKQCVEDGDISVDSIISFLGDTITFGGDL